MKREQIDKYHPGKLRKRISSDDQERFDDFAKHIRLDELFEKMRQEDLFTKKGFEQFQTRNQQVASDVDVTEKMQNERLSVLGSVAETFDLTDKIRGSESEKEAMRIVIDQTTKNFAKGCIFPATLVLSAALILRRQRKSKNYDS